MTKTKSTKPKKSIAAPAAKQRQLKQKPYKAFRLQKRVIHQRSKLISGPKLFRRVLGHIKANWKLFGGIALVYMILTLVIVQGFGIGRGVEELKLTLEDTFSGTSGSLLAGLTLFGYLVGSTGATAGEGASVYQSIVLIIVSLAIIWALRQTYASKSTSTKESFYRGMYPLVPVLLVLLVIGLQLLPLLLAGWLYSVVVVGGIAVTGVEVIFWMLLIGLLVLLSFYMLTSSTFAFYIATLPDMTPFQALRSARKLVQYRRWTVMRKILFLPFILLICGAIVMVPVLLIATPLAEWLFFSLSMAALVVVHAYMYSLYRELL